MIEEVFKKSQHLGGRRQGAGGRGQEAGGE